MTKEIRFTAYSDGLNQKEERIHFVGKRKSH
jgi:hypothetical protein